MIAEIHEVRPERFNNALKLHLKSNNKIVPIKDHDIMKTGTGKQQAPSDDTWYLTRVASVMRRIAVMGSVTSEQLAEIYGCMKNRGCRPDKFAPAFKEIGDSILENLKNIGWIVFNDKSEAVLTEQGKSVVKEIIQKVRE